VCYSRTVGAGKFTLVEPALGMAGGLQTRVLSLWLASFLKAQRRWWGVRLSLPRRTQLHAPQTLSNTCEKHSNRRLRWQQPFFLACDECAANCSRRQTVCTDHVLVPANVHVGETECNYSLAVSWSAT